MENEKIKSRPGSHGKLKFGKKSWNFEFLRKMCLLPTLWTHNDTDSPPIAVQYFTLKNGLSKKSAAPCPTFDRTETVQYIFIFV